MHAQSGPLINGNSTKRAPLGMFADDTAVIGNTPEDLQQLLDTINDWCTQHGMTINIDKTEIVVFKPHAQSRPDMAVWTLNGEIIKISDQFKYLGVLFHSWRPTCFATTHTCKQAKMAIGALCRKLSDLDIGKHPDAILKLYKSCIMPALTYGSELFGVYDMSVTDPVATKDSATELCQITFLKGTVLKLRKSTPSWIIYRELGMYPTQYYMLRDSIRFLNRVLRLNDTEYVKLALMQTFKDARMPGVCNWFTRLKDILMQIEFDIADIDHIQTHGINVKEVLSTWRCHYASIIWGNIPQDPHQAPSKGMRACTYHNYFAEDMPEDGSEWKLASYLHHPSIPRHHSTALARFRTGCHDLRIETLKRARIPRNQRLCDRCTERVVQDEPHFIMHCPALDELRERYETVFPPNNHLINIRQLFGNPDIQKSLASFIHAVNNILKPDSES
jgi:Reverse transcriptase (RNA-dependent DNA polymerase)